MFVFLSLFLPRSLPFLLIFQSITSALGVAGTDSLLPFINLKPQVNANLHMELSQLWLQLWLLFPFSLFSGIPAAFILWAQPVRERAHLTPAFHWVGNNMDSAWQLQYLPVVYAEYLWVIFSLKWDISELGEAVNWRMDFKRAHWGRNGKIFRTTMENSRCCKSVSGSHICLEETVTR